MVSDTNAQKPQERSAADTCFSLRNYARLYGPEIFGV